MVEIAGGILLAIAGLVALLVVFVGGLWLMLCVIGVVQLVLPLFALALPILAVWGGLAPLAGNGWASVICLGAAIPWGMWHFARYRKSLAGAADSVVR
jgi:hypothetical protein